MQPEVYGMFAACIPQADRSSFNAQPVRQRQGLVPDLLLTVQWESLGPERRLLFEVKTLHFGTSTYPAGAADQQRCLAVTRRADAIPGEYTSKARRVDERFCHTAAGKVGPVEARLRAHDPVKGLVFWCMV